MGHTQRGIHDGDRRLAGAAHGFAALSLDDLKAPYERIATLLEDAVKVMQRRAKGLADGLVRKYVPTVEEPLIWTKERIAQALAAMIVVVIVVLLFGWLLLAWAVLVVLVGLHDVQALTIYALGALWIWRRGHRASFDHLVGRRVRSGWVRWCGYERRWRNTMLLGLFGEMTIALTLKRHEFVAGEPIAASVSVGGGWDDKLRAIRIELGYRNTYYRRERSSDSDGRSRSSEDALATERVIVATEKFPVDHARTSAGPGTFDVTLALPTDAPASVRRRVAWSVTAILDRRLRLGRRQKVPIIVLASPFAHTAWAEAKQVSDAECDMFLELPGRVARVGETLSGVLHVSPKYQFEARSVRVELEHRMHHEDDIVRTLGSEEKVILAARTTFVPGDPQQLPFQITIPAGAAPSLRAKHNEVRWHLKGICARGLLHRDYCVKAELLVNNTPPESECRALGLGAMIDEDSRAVNARVVQALWRQAVPHASGALPHDEDRSPESDTYELGPDNGSLTVKTGRDGPAAKAGHDLLIDVMSWAATFNMGDHPSLEFSADPTSLRVREGTGGAKPLGQEGKADIHGSIDTHVLKKRSISFRSSSIESWQGTLKIKGDLEMGETTKPISFELREQRGTLAGTVTLAQSEWGIKPFSVLFGAMRVKDEVKVCFDAALV